MNQPEAAKAYWLHLWTGHPIMMGVDTYTMDLMIPIFGWLFDRVPEKLYSYLPHMSLLVYAFGLYVIDNMFNCFLKRFTIFLFLFLTVKSLPGLNMNDNAIGLVPLCFCIVKIFLSITRIRLSEPKHTETLSLQALGRQMYYDYSKPKSRFENFPELFLMMVILMIFFFVFMFAGIDKHQIHILVCMLVMVMVFFMVFLGRDAGGNSALFMLPMVLVTVIGIFMFPIVLELLEDLLKRADKTVKGTHTDSSSEKITMTGQTKSVLFGLDWAFTSIPLTIDTNSGFDCFRMILGIAYTTFMLTDEMRGPGLSVKSAIGTTKTGVLPQLGRFSVSNLSSCWIIFYCLNVIFHTFYGTYATLCFLMVGSILGYLAWTIFGEPYWAGRGVILRLTQLRVGGTLYLGNSPGTMRVFITYVVIVFVYTLHTYLRGNVYTLVTLPFLLVAHRSEGFFVSSVGYFTVNFPLLIAFMFTQPLSKSILENRSSVEESEIGVNSTTTTGVVKQIFKDLIEASTQKEEEVSFPKIDPRICERKRLATAEKKCKMKAEYNRTARRSDS